MEDEIDVTLSEAGDGVAQSSEKDDKKEAPQAPPSQAVEPTPSLTKETQPINDPDKWFKAIN